MDLLLDTHAFLWWDSQDRRLGASAAEMISDPLNRIFVSAATIWEIAVKQEIGRLVFTGSAVEATLRNGFLPLPIAGEHVETAATLPALHKDPFDRLLIAQALALRLLLVTADRQIARYPVPQLWAR